MQDLVLGPLLQDNLSCCICFKVAGAAQQRRDTARFVEDTRQEPTTVAENQRRSEIAPCALRAQVQQTARRRRPDLQLLSQVSMAVEEGVKWNGVARAIRHHNQLLHAVEVAG